MLSAKSKIGHLAAIDAAAAKQSQEKINDPENRNRIFVEAKKTATAVALKIKDHLSPEFAQYAHFGGEWDQF